MWEPRLQCIQDAWQQVEIQSVAQGARRAALVFGEAAVRASGLPHTRLIAERFAVGPVHDVLTEAFMRGDDNAMGVLLGYPPCCRAFFAETWAVGTGDTTWQMTHGDTNTSGPLACNILGRWMGVRLVPHLPCSFRCRATVAFAEALRPFWLEQELAWVEEILSWPMEWSALHGIAEIKWPILKVSAATGQGSKRVVQRLGTRYPAEGARGVSFPFAAPQAEVAPLRLVPPRYRANGFSSYAAMMGAHNMILRVLTDMPPQGAVLDLGAGNGELIDRITRAFGCRTAGIEVDTVRAGGHSNITVADLADTDALPTTFDTLLVSVNRFGEIPHLEQWCRDHARQTIVYSYDEPQFGRIL